LARVVALSLVIAPQETVDHVLHIVLRVMDVDHFAATKWQYVQKKDVEKRGS